MTDSVFSEKRTRSQLTLPDNILAIPECSPLKGARTALRNHIIHDPVPSSSKTPSKEESDDELLLSPGKTMMKKSNSKRSASPPLQDEYSLSSDPPPGGRELKRVRRDELVTGYRKGDIALDNATLPSYKRLATSHSQNQSNSSILGSRSARKGLVKSRKPISTLSLSPPPRTISPTPEAPNITRSQSVPVFFNSNEVPRIDFKNPPPSPKRRRSPSRSPSKERGPKLRITSAGSLGTPKLPTIHDDVVMDGIHPESESGVPQDHSTRARTPEPRPLTSVEEIVPASPSSREMVPASPPMQPTVLPSPPSRVMEVIPASPSPPPPPSATTPAPPTTLAVPSTPLQLSSLSSMSPLRPMPDTPLPPRAVIDSGVDDRYKNGAGWNIVVPKKELQPPPPQPAKPQLIVTTSAPKSFIPRPSTATMSASVSKSSLSSEMGPPALPITKKLTASGSGVKVSSFGSINGLAAIMKNQKEQAAQRQLAKGQIVDKGKKPTQRPGPKAGPPVKPKQKAKEKMRPREKPETKKTLIVPLPDEEEEEDIPESPWAFKLQHDSQMAYTESAGSSTDNLSTIESSESLITVPTEDKDTVMVQSTSEMNLAEDQLAWDTQMVEDGAMQEPEENHLVPAADVFEQSQPEPLPSAEDIQVDVQVENPITENPIETTVSVNDEVTKSNAEAAPLPETTEPHTEPQPLEDTMETAVPADTGVVKSKDNEAEVPETTELKPLARAGESKLPRKKRQPISVAQPTRMTRSVSNRSITTLAESSIVVEQRKKPAPGPATTKRAGLAKKVTSTIKTKEVQNSEDVVMDVVQSQAVKLPPGSPMRTTPKKPPPKPLITNGDKQLLQVTHSVLPAASTPTRTKSPVPSPSPSPTKIARSTLMAMRPTAASLARTFPSQLSNAPNSSLFTLSNALEKLRMPPPSRPNTSLGFNPDAGSDDKEIPARSKDDVTVGRVALGVGRSGSTGLQRSVTLGAGSFKIKESLAIASSSKALSAGGKNLVQKPLSMFMSGKASQTKPGAVRRMGLASGKPLFGVGGGVRRRISKKSNLPVVIGSPVKGGAKTVDESMQEYNEAAGDEEEEGGSIFNAIINGSSATELMANLLAEVSDKGKEKETVSRPAHSSRRVSMLSRDLTHSLSSLPPLVPVAGPSSSTIGLMGPPPTPPSGSRSARGTGSSPSSSPSTGGRLTATRSSARIAKIVPPPMKAKNSSEGKRSSSEAPNPALEALKVLKDCVIFVDVKSEDGDEAGSLFVEMLEGVGARVLTRVGQTCTHVVFKNGMMSTITRWKLLRDPKPLVVGIGWVVECIEQKKRVDEADFLIDLNHTNVAGTHKRRRSMLPKLFGEDEPEKEESFEGDRSVDGSVSSINADDDLTPLERARRRKSMIIGPRP